MDTYAFSEWPGFLVNTVAITFQIMEKTVATVSLSSSYRESGRIADSII